MAHENTGNPDGLNFHHSGEIPEQQELYAAKLQSEQTGKILSSAAKKRLLEVKNLEYPPLLKMEPLLGIRLAMWFV